MTHDLVIIGGGPAGSAAAHRAAQLGARVLVLEKKPMPRPKLCGGWVSRYALGLLPFAIPLQIIEVPFRRMTITDGDSTLVHSPKEPLGIFVDRARFDQFLLKQAQEAGAEVRWEKALAIRAHGAELRVTTGEAEYNASGVIIATGATGDLIKTVRPLDTARESAACLEQRVPVEYAEQLSVNEGEGRFFVGTAPHGFGWVLHHGSYILVGIGQRRSGEATLLPNFRRLWERLTLPTTLIGPIGPFRPIGHIIPLGGHPRQSGRGRCLLAGDAAGMVDAQSGEGIAGAIESGQLAAVALTRDSSSGAARTYSELCELSLLPHLRWSRRFAWGFYRNPRRVLSVLASLPDALGRYTAVVDHRESYPRYMLWLLGQRLLKSISGGRSASRRD